VTHALGAQLVGRTLPERLHKDAIEAYDTKRFPERKDDGDEG
jgi:hypothetical protein